MFAVMTTFPLTPPLHTAPVPASHTTSLFNASYPFSTSDDEESTTVNISPNCNTTPPQNPLGFAQQTHYKPIYTVCDDLEVDKEEDFQTVPLNSNHRTTEEIPETFVHTQTVIVTFNMSLPSHI